MATPRKRKPGRIRIAAERLAAAVRDAQATNAARVTGEPAAAVASDTTRDDLIREHYGTPEERLEFARGGFEHREAQLAKFNGKESTPEDTTAYFFAELKAMQQEEADGTAWHLHEGDPKRFDEEPVNPQIELGSD